MMLGMIFSWALSLATIQPSSWMQEQVKNELKPFHKGFTFAQIEKSFKKIQRTFDGDVVPIIQVIVKDGNCLWNFPANLDTAYFPLAENLCASLKELLPLPDMSFLVCLDPDCEHPVYLHESMVPIFSMAKSKRNHKVVMFPKALLFPERFALYESISSSSEKMPWHERKPCVLWRPKTLKNEYLYNDWEWDPAIRMLLLGKHHPDDLNFYLSNDALFKKVPWWVQNYFSKSGLNTSPLTPAEHLNFRYLLVCDQMQLPQDLDWQLFSGSLLFKGTSKLLEWYHSQLEPNVHFMPILYYGEDLIESLTWAKENDEECQEIVQNAKHFAQEILSKDAQLSYFLCLLESYAKLIR